MWFKQAQLFQLTDGFRYTPTALIEKLEELEFQECLPSMPYGAGWVSPVDEEDAPLIQTMNGYTHDLFANRGENITSDCHSPRTTQEN